MRKKECLCLVTLETQGGQPELVRVCNCLMMESAMARSPVKRKGKSTGKVNRCHQESRNPFLRTPPSWFRCLQHMLRQHCHVGEFSLLLSSYRDRSCSNLGPLSDHSSREVVNVTEVPIPEVPGFLGKAEILVPHSGTLSSGTWQLLIPAKSQMLVLPSVFLPFIRNNIKCLIIFPHLRMSLTIDKQLV